MLDENTTQPSNDVQTEQATISDDNVDYKQLYLDEVQNAKKLRKRAQDGEVMNQEFLRNQETAKVKSLKEQEKFKELSENLQSQLDQVSPYKEKWDTFETKRKDSLLAKLPEADRERMATKDLDTLEYIVSKIEESKPAPQPAIAGQSRNAKAELPEGNPFESMDKDSIRNNWGKILDTYKNKNN